VAPSRRRLLEPGYDHPLRMRTRRRRIASCEHSNISWIRQATAKRVASLHASPERRRRESAAPTLIGCELLKSAPPLKPCQGPDPSRARRNHRKPVARAVGLARRMLIIPRKPGRSTAPRSPRRCAGRRRGGTGLALLE